MVREKGLHDSQSNWTGRILIRLTNFVGARVTGTLVCRKYIVSGSCKKKKYVLKALLETFSESPTSLATSY